jgi:hypothetical protein
VNILDRTVQRTTMLRRQPGDYQYLLVADDGGGLKSEAVPELNRKSP